MLLLLLIAFGAGLITAFSPCILPVLPIVLAGGGSGGPKRKPYAIVAGLVASFTAFTLAASSLLSALHLAQDTLNRIAIALLLVLAATLVVPQLGVWLERPFAFLSRRRGGDLGGGFLLGLTLGLVFVPCAGPVLGAVTSAAGSHRVGVHIVFVTLAYALGAAIPMLLVARGGRRITSLFRAQQQRIRVGMGVLMAVGAVAIYEGWETSLQTRFGDYTTQVQSWIEGNGYAKRQLAKLRGAGGTALAAAKPAGTALPDFGAAPDFLGISDWLNSRPLSVTDLRGKVVLVDFWTYSCINCLRTLPHLRAWYAAYHKYGLEIVGVHTPEFAFEHVLANVRKATRELSVTWPVALDNNYVTWNAYSNQYWPAEYLVDRRGHVRRAHFGEGEYAQSEQLIRRLLGVGVPKRMTQVADATPTGLLSPETYLGAARLDPARYVGKAPVVGREALYRFGGALAQNALAYDGRWQLLPQQAIAGRGARLRFHFVARNVYVVLGGKGRVEVLAGGRPVKTIDVSEYRLYTAVSAPKTRDAVLELRLSPGVRAYSFTFG
ncbi:MAG TPA: cytochrome c biogenesis protein DipZ [Gaiellaceae bacterium]|nr:cytochrome c biogenesis protein DipZ [Gaiellaceae bacterium]